MVIMILIYGVILAYAAKLISDGSEELLELFPKYSTIARHKTDDLRSHVISGTVIGALLLPVLGAIPDAFMVFISGS